jgi:hypothetical protein
VNPKVKLPRLSSEYGTQINLTLSQEAVNVVLRQARLIAKQTQNKPPK